MLINTQTLYGNKLAALDGDIGQIKDFYFDDQSWVIRYLVADTGAWLTGRLVLLSPHAFGKFDPTAKALHLKLHKKQIEDSPSIESHRPVSRQYELEYYRHYGWPTYWEGDALGGIGGFPTILPPAPEILAGERKHLHRDDKHLQSASSVTGYAIQTTDGPIGRVTGFKVDDRSWAIRELVVETGHWYAGKEILIAPNKVAQISYEESTVSVNLTKADIQQTAENQLAQAGTGAQASDGFPTE